MTDLEPVLDSSDKCIESTIKEDKGAGANAGSRADVVFITTSPLSELVWSPQKGLSVKYAESSSNQKKSPLLWNAESFSLMILPPKCPNDGEGCSTRNLTEGDLNSAQLDQLSENQGLKDPPQSTTRMPLVSGKTVLEQHQSSRNNGQSSDLLSCNVEMFRPDLKQADATCMSTFRTSPDHARKVFGTTTCKALGLAEVSAHEDSLLAKCGVNLSLVSGIRDAECGHSDLAIDNAKSTNSKMFSQLAIFNQLGEKCSASGDSAEFRDRNEVCRAAKSRSPDEVKVDIGQVLHTNIPTPTGAVLNKNIHSSSLVKTNENITSGTEDSENVLKERADSHESVESSSSKELISTGKRVWSSETEMPAGVKRFKNESKEDWCSGSFLSQKSSFMKWISAITSGSFGSDQATRPTTSMAIVSQPSQQVVNITSLPTSHDKGKDIACRTNCFQSIFQALYCPSLKLQQTSTSGRNLVHQRAVHALEEQDAIKQLGYGTHHISDDIDVNLHDAVPVRGERANDDVGKLSLHDAVPIRAERVNDDVGIQFFGEQFNISNIHGVCHREDKKHHDQTSVSTERLDKLTAPVEELPLSVINKCSAHLSTNEKLKYKIEGKCYFGKIGSRKSSAVTGFGQPLVLKATPICSSVPNNSSNLDTDSRSNYLESLWVTRLSQKPSACMPNSEQCNQGISSTIDGDNRGKFNPSSRNDVAPNRTYNNSKSCCCSKDERCGTCVLDSRSSDLRASTWLDTNQKLKSKLKPVLSSLRFKKSQPMASVFAKRLDALRHILPQKIPTNSISINVMCLFCGKRGHDLRECSELLESELADLDKSFNTYGSTLRSSFICIRCFQLDHWAISCPYVLAKRKKIHESNISAMSSGNCIRLLGKPENPSASCDRRIILWTGGRQEHHQHFDAHLIPQQRNMCVENMDLDVGATAIPTNAKEVEPVNKSLKGNSVKVKQSVSSSKNDTKEHLIIPAYDIYATEVTDSPTEIFETIRKLRLSRSDVIRWMKSPNSHSNLEGFFLRLRLGKRDHDLGGTGYHVARVNGGTCRNRLSVSIGDFQSVVDCRFVSNHEFREDELMTWWTTTLRGDGKLASRDELNKKLDERMNLHLYDQVMSP